MKTIKSGIKNWKTTIIGIAIAVLTIMQDSTDLSKIEDWIFPALITALGILMRDADKSSEASGVAPAIIAIIGLSMFFTSCTPATYAVNTVPYADAIKSNPQSVIMDKKDVTPVGGFQANINGSVVTDYGTIGLTPSGVSVDAVVVDLRSGK